MRLVKDFHYKSNVWELDKVSSTCIYVQVVARLYMKEREILKINTESIVLQMISISIRYVEQGDLCMIIILSAFEGNDFNIAANAIKNSNVILVGGNTANNEARLLSLLKQKFEIKLVNDTLKRYKEFISVYYGSGAKSVALNDIANYKLIISIGSSIKK